MSHQEHQEAAASDRSLGPAACAVLTCSDTRTPAEDRGGDLVVSALESAGRRYKRGGRGVRHIA